MVVRQKSWLMVPGVLAVVLATAGSAVADSDPGGNTIRQSTECEVDNTGTISPDIVPGASADTTMDARCRNRLFGTSRLHDSAVNQKAQCDTSNTGPITPTLRSPGSSSDTALTADCANDLFNEGRMEHSTLDQSSDCDVDNTGAIDTAAGTGSPGSSLDTTLASHCGNSLSNTGRIANSGIGQQAHCDTSNTGLINPDTAGGASPGASADTVFSAACDNRIANSGTVDGSTLGQRAECDIDNTARVPTAINTSPGSSSDATLETRCRNEAHNTGRLDHLTLDQNSGCDVDNSGTLAGFAMESPGASADMRQRAACDNRLVNTGDLRSVAIKQHNDCDLSNSGDIRPDIEFSPGASADTELSTQCGNNVLNLAGPDGNRSSSGGLLAPGSTVDQDNHCGVDNSARIARFVDESPGASADTSLPANCDNTVLQLGRGGRTDARAHHIQQSNDCVDRNSAEFGDVENSPGANADAVVSASCRNIVVGS
ncbi:hypothetical protein [Streptomyces sp. NPDC048636]|uniref:hypothetical protein n=1 Tax=Streptomyces sp. NPDC048636 TaxID=3155762 RepID=UPI003449554C